ncbi:MAG TPA: TMEM175 family protein [Niabella sp.]|jgi:uncharacterized membrane protein|nr:TMEM175 family protein [Chitinophagaceae bacterium]HRN49343.1 TMEM175 family protein [Niabella sp.]HRO85180.1 TMEM175 family protein [Niabella sp.]HUN03844.1 TMEM175 family protein [Niabella sp.]
MSKIHYNLIAGRDTGRIIAISDGVFGVALTLLMLELRVPVMEGIHSDKQLIDTFLNLGPKFLVSFLAFMTTGIFWMGHSAQYKHIEKSDRNLSWLNLLFLLTVILLPFSTSFLGNYTNYKFPIAIYWLNIFLMGAMLYVHWAYAYKHGFVSTETREIVNKPLRTRIIIAQTLYFFGALMCFISPYLSIAFIIAVQLNYAFAFINDPRT